MITKAGALPRALPALGKPRLLSKIAENRALFLFCVPGLIVTFIFHYVPLYGVQIAFRNYSVAKGIWGSNWAGFRHFERFFSSPDTVKIIWNTLILSIYSLVVGFPIPIILALLLNNFRHKSYGKIIQSVTYAPNFISVVVMCGMIILFLSPRIGIINKLVELTGGEAVNFMGERLLWRHIYVWSGVWQTMGWNSVVYFAALSGVSPDLHEAAIVDGASKFQRIIHIDLPSIMPIAVMLLILSFGSILSVGFEKAFALQNPLNLDVSEIISTFVYKQGILLPGQQDYATAVGLFNSAVNAVLLVSVNYISRKLSDISMW